MSKQVITGFLWGILGAIAISGCQNSPPPPIETTSPEPTPITTPVQSDFKIPAEEIKASQPWNILVVVKDSYNPETKKHGDLYQVQVWDGAKQAAEDFGLQVELLPNTCHTCVEDQIRAINNRLQAGNIDGMVIMVTDSIRLAPVIEKAINQGIPVVAMDTPLNSEDILTFVVFDNVAGGKVMGEWVVEQLDGQGNVLLLDGSLEQQNAVDRKNGFLAGLRSGNINILDTQSADWSQKNAKTITQDWLDQYSDIDAIIAANYAMALGAREAVEAAGQEEDILITGFDAMPPALNAIQNGKIAATIDQTPALQARLSLQLLLRHLENGETFPDRVVMPNIPLINQANIDREK
ncbi:sugar ABC transporter substrate-binding protein [Spirulina sp. CS-785/01]|uniref:sugar ABC transporter substrate-binding protein n=1 Tax=Spirulina sp. CS-785/01 TaxID=3021716 RepID=UPI00232B3583|nr:sugar ABC transporter substrate-binding protein [Spirulina sp. CS-785/01]MDB9315086.1 sugar ABC transporter substrate-binding protein [Spirulina sp. CS-785/01]